MAASKILVIAPFRRFSGDKVAVTKAKKKNSNGEESKVRKNTFSQEKDKQLLEQHKGHFRNDLANSNAGRLA